MKNISTKLHAIFLIIVIFISDVAAGSSMLVKVEEDQFVIDLRYNSDRNFLKRNVYEPFGLSECYVHPALYKSLQQAEPLLLAKGFKLVLWDCYRPPEVQKAMWKLVPDARYVANPKFGSSHNRGVAIDVTLAAADGTLLPMPTEFDDFSYKAAIAYRCKNNEKEKCANRDVLVGLMKAADLVPITSEWWHYQLPKTGSYPIIERHDAGR